MSKIFLAFYTVFTFLAAPAFAVNDPKNSPPNQRLCANYAVNAWSTSSSPHFRLNQEAPRGRWNASSNRAWPISSSAVIAVLNQHLSVYDLFNKTVASAEISLADSFGAPFGSTGFYYLTATTDDAVRYLRYFEHGEGELNSNALEIQSSNWQTFRGGRQFVWGSKNRANLLNLETGAKSASFFNLDPQTRTFIQSRAIAVEHGARQYFIPHISRSGRFVYLQINKDLESLNQGWLIDLYEGKVTYNNDYPPSFTFRQVMDDGSIAYIDPKMSKIFWNGRTIPLSENHPPYKIEARGKTLIKWNPDQVTIYHTANENPITLEINAKFGKISHLDIPPNGQGEISSILVLTDTGIVLRASQDVRRNSGSFGPFKTIDPPMSLQGNTPVFAGLLGEGDEVLILGNPIATVPGGVLNLPIPRY